MTCKHDVLRVGGKDGAGVVVVEGEHLRELVCDRCGARWLSPQASMVWRRDAASETQPDLPLEYRK